MNSYSLMEWVFKVFSLRLFKKKTFFENTEQEKKKEFFYSLVFSLSVLRFSSMSDSLCPHTSITPLRIDLEDRTVQIADLYIGRCRSLVACCCCRSDGVDCWLVADLEV